MCHCGQPLHYSDPTIQAQVQALVDQLGEYAVVTSPEGSWKVQRHYIALHGLKAEELPHLGFEPTEPVAGEPPPPSPDRLDVWVIFERPHDYPNHYVVVRQYVNRGGGGVFYDPNVRIFDTLEDAQASLPPGLTFMGPDAENPQIVEVWI